MYMYMYRELYIYLLFVFQESLLRYNFLLRLDVFLIELLQSTSSLPQLISLSPDPVIRRVE